VSHSRDLAVELAGGRQPAAVGIRLGVVNAVGTRNDGFATYTILTVSGLEMRCMAAYASPAPGDVVVWISDGSQAICLGPRL
jgi:hypothetical protein